MKLSQKSKRTLKTPKIKRWSHAAMGLVFMAAGPALFAAPGDLLITVTVPVPSQTGIGIGIDYDGTNILYTNYGDSTVYKTDLTGANLGSVSLINSDNSPFSGGLNAIAYNFSDGMLYGGGWSSTDLYKTDLATGITILVKANAVPYVYGFIDGLAWDPSNNTFWMSDDVQCNVEHLDVLGNNIGGFDGCSVTTRVNSGLAVSLSGRLWYGTDGFGEIYALDTSSNPPGNLGQFASPGGRDEDMVCGPQYTKPDGTVVETLLSKDAYNNTFAVIEVAPGECTSPAEQKGRMTGGGSVFTEAGSRVTHGFELFCNASKGPSNLQINWGKGQKFHLEELTSASCSDDANISEGSPAAGFDTYKGAGTGRYNGVSGATVRWKFSDAGEPGKGADFAEIEVRDLDNNVVLSASGFLNSGNQQAHPE